MWYLATYSDEPNAVPVDFKDITADGKLVVGDVFMDTTLKNVKLNGKSYSYNTGTGQQKRTLIFKMRIIFGTHFLYKIQYFKPKYFKV